MNTDDLNISRFTQHTLYDGAVPQPTRAAAPNLAGISRPGATLTTDLLAKNAGVQQQEATAFTEAAAERNNYTVDQLRQAASQQIQIDVSAEMAQRLSLADGSENAFYNADGSFREDAYKRYRAAVVKRLSGLDKGYIGDQAQAKAAAAQTELQSKILGQLDTTLAAQMAPRAKSAAERNAKLLAAQGRHAEAAAVIASCEYMPEAERQLAIHDLDQDSALWNAQSACNNGDTSSYLRYITDPEIWNNLTPETQRKLLAMQGAAQSHGGQIVERTDPQTGKKTIGKEPPELPCGTPAYLVNLYNTNNGNLTQGDAKQALSDLLPQLVTDLIADPKSEEQSQRVLNIVSIADNSQTEYAKKLITARRAYLTGQGSFDFKTTWSQMPKDLLFSDAYLAQLRSWTSAAHKTNAKGELTPSARRAAEQAKARREQMQQTITGLESTAWSEYQKWEQSLDHKPTARESADSYTNIIENLLRKAKITRNIRENSYIANLSDDTAERRQAAAAEHSEQVAAEVQREDKRRLDAKKAAATQQATRDTQKIFGQDFDTYWNCDTNRFSTAKLPESADKNVLYVPKEENSPLVGRTIQVQSGHAIIDCEIREADIQGTALSTHATWQLGIISGQDHSQIRIDEQGVAHLTRASEIPQEQMGRFIFDSEARTDSHGNMSAYQSPEGLEYGGLNMKYDPQEVAVIDRLVKAGQHAEAKAYAIRAYITKTQGVADAMNAIGLYSAPLEYSLRDIAFNMGEGGLSQVVRKATGADSSVAPYAAIAGYMQTHTEADLLKALYTARGEHYEAIITADPTKSRFRTGWHNRNRAVLNNALQLIGQ